MKRIISVFISAFLMLQSGLATVSAEETHWAQEAAEELAGKGIISGDAGGLRLDDEITRAEFAKVINRNFSYTQTDSMNFPDVSEDAWYYNELLIARKAGYLTGDSEGHVCPDMPLNRAEASVVFARILNLSLEETELSFVDRNEIGEWAKPFIHALVKTNVIKGYEDGSFRAQNSMTRGELFTMVVRINEYLNPNKPIEIVPTEDIFNGSTPGNIGIISGGSSGSGSSGGGGSTSASKLQITKIDTKNMMIYWSSVPKASGYTVELTRTTEGRNTTFQKTGISGVSFDMAQAVKELISEGKTALETFKVQVAPEGNSKYTASKTEEFHITNDTVEIPDDIRVEQSFDSENLETLKIVWSAVEHAQKYEILLKNDVTEIELAVNGEEAYFPEGYEIKQEEKIIFKVYADDPEILDSLPLEKTLECPLFAGGTGEAESPYLIRNERHFYHIQDFPSMQYKIVNDFEIKNFQQIPSFSGVLIGEADGKPAVITYHLNTADGNQALFKLITGTVENIGLEGTFQAGTNSAPLTVAANGTSTKPAEILNCYNNMKVSVTAGARGSALISEAQYAKIDGCYNMSDDVTLVGNFCAGVLGVMNAGCNVTNCYNLGDITFKGNTCGGVIGAFFGNGSSLYNAGKITQTGTGSVGGVIGQIRQNNKDVTCVFNTGDIVSGNGNSNFTGAIAAEIYPNTGGVTNINQIYNVGNVTAGSKHGGLLYGRWLTTQGTAVFGDEIYTLEGCAYNIENPEIKTKTFAELKAMQFSGDVWTSDVSSGYPFPQFKKIPYHGDYKPVLPKLPSPSFSVDKDVNGNVWLDITGSRDTVSYHAVIEKDGTVLKTYDSAAGGSTARIDVSDTVTEEKVYIIRLTAISDKLNAADSDETVQKYTHSLLKPISAPVLITEWDEISGKEAYTVSWEAIDNAVGYNVIVKKDGETVAELSGITETSYNLIENDKIIFGSDYLVTVTALAENEQQNSAGVTAEISTVFADSEGDGSEAKPYVIKNYRHFANMVKNNDAKYYSVQRDITLPEDYAPMKKFVGHISGYMEDGSRSTIDFGTRTGLTEFGLFFEVSNNATVSGLRFAGSLSGTTYISCVAKDLSGGAVIDNCEAAADITVTGNYAAGIVTRHIKGIISNCFFSGSITSTSGNAYAGGIAAQIWGSSAAQTEVITGCYNIGTINATGQYVGGICAFDGYAFNLDKNIPGGIIEKCYNAGTVKGGGNVGGIVGAGYGTVRECYNAGSVTGTTNVGGIGGNLCSINNNVTNPGAVTNCYNTGDVTATNGHAGGIVCTIRYNTVTNVYNIGTVTGKNRSPVYRLRYPSGGSAMTGEDQNTVTNAYHDDKVTDAYDDTVLKTLDELKNPSIFDQTGGASGSDIWQIAEDEFGYPYLQLKNNPHKVVFH